MLRDLNFVRCRAAGEPCIRPEEFCTMVDVELTNMSYLMHLNAVNISNQLVNFLCLYAIEICKIIRLEAYIHFDIFLCENM